MHCEGDKVLTNQEDVRCGMHLEKDPIQKEKTAEKSVAVQKESDKRTVPSAAVGMSHALQGVTKCMKSGETALYAEWI
jgi:hypothetical protein